jgi:RNA-directed DNA polymerase
MLQRAKDVTGEGKWTRLEYVRFADDFVVMVNLHARHEWLFKAVNANVSGGRSKNYRWN